MRFSGRKYQQIDILPDSYEYILQFKDDAEKYNLKYCIVIIPNLFKAGFEEKLISALKKDNVNYINLQGLANEFTINEFMASRFDSHPSAKVHKRIGEKLSELFKEVNN